MTITFDHDDPVDLMRGRRYVDALMLAGFVLMERNAAGELVRFLGFNIQNPPRVLVAVDLRPDKW